MRQILVTQVMIRVALSALTLVLALANASLSGGFSLARSAGMAGAHLALAEGVAAAYVNPANLGLSSHRQNSIQLVGVSYNVANNSFTMGDYNRYNGALLTLADKREILDKIPVDGLLLTADAEASVAGVSYNKFAFTFTGYGAGEASLGKDVLELLLYGNSFGDTISIDGTFGSAWSYASFDISYGTPIYTLGTRQLAVGASAHIIKGIYIADVSRVEGFAATLATGFQGDGAVIVNTAEGGSGFAVDVGAALQLNENYTLGLSLRNLLSAVSWSKNAEERGFMFSFDTVSVSSISNDSIFVTSDFTNAISGFSSDLPSALTVGLARTTGRLLWALDWEQGFSRNPGASTTPQLTAGVEYAALPYLPLRAGLGLGGRHGTQLAFGGGVELSAFRLDLAVLTSGTALTSSASKGARFAVSTGLAF